MRPALLLLYLALLAPPSVRAQADGRLAGTIADDAGAPLAGANVVLAGTALGAATSPDGTFALDAVPPGTYTLQASLLGYRTERVPVTVRAGEEATVDLVLREAPITLGEALAVAERPYTAASSRAVRRFDLQTRPARSTQDLLRLAPGLVVAQHAGGGKAEQLFLRGFDADHGTDVAVYVDGVPVNMVSHGHGQGYADLHYVIPETVEAIDVAKGPYFAEYGNLATAGAVAFRTREHLEANEVRVEAGQFETVGLTALYGLPEADGHRNAYFAGSFFNSAGPFESAQDFRRFNLFGKVHNHLGDGATLALDAGAYGATWDASGQIPVRAVASGLIGRFGAVNDLEGGTTGHQHANLRYAATCGPADFEAQAYAVRYDFKLFSDFTFFLDDSLRGDMIEQTDERTVLGLQSQYRTRHALPVAGALGTATLGGGVRADDAAVALWKSPERARDTRLVGADVAERNFFLWAQEELVLGPRVRLLLGLRGDYFTFDVEDHLDAVEDPPGGLPHASGYTSQLVVSPKANLVVTPVPVLDLFANAGTGFHSNDARNVVIGRRTGERAQALERAGLSEEQIAVTIAAEGFDPAQRNVETLPRAVGGEVGARARLGGRLTLGAAAWLLDLEREYVYVGDAGTTELSGRTRRVGLDLEARLQLLGWLAADADLNLSRGRARDEPTGADHIPLAPTVTSAGGLTVQRERVRGSLRYRHVGDRPANEDGSVTAEGYTVVDAFAACDLGRFTLSLAVENLFDVAWNEAQFDTESRLPGEAAPVSELHFTPGNPFNVRLGLGVRF
jgi:outer membrane receptor protein involved in Fe transport